MNNKLFLKIAVPNFCASILISPLVSIFLLKLMDVDYSVKSIIIIDFVCNIFVFWLAYAVFIFINAFNDNKNDE